MVAERNDDRFVTERRPTASAQETRAVEANELQPGHRAPLRPALGESFERTFAKLEPGLRYLADR